MEDNNNDSTQSFVPLAKGTEVGHYKIVEKIGNEYAKALWDKHLQKSIK